MTVDEAVIRLNELRDTMVVDGIYLTVNIHVSKSLKETSSNSKIKFIEDVLSIIENEFGITVAQIKSNSRSRPIVEARHIFYYMLKNSRYEMGLTELGSVFNRAHSSVLHGIKTVNNLIDFNKEFRQNIEKLMFKMSIL